MPVLKPGPGGQPADAPPQGQAPDDSALAGLMQAMGIAMPASNQSSAPVGTVDILPDGAVDPGEMPIGQAMAAPPAGLVAPATATGVPVAVPGGPAMAARAGQSAAAVLLASTATSQGPATQPGVQIGATGTGLEGGDLPTPGPAPGSPGTADLTAGATDADGQPLAVAQAGAAAVQADNMPGPGKPAPGGAGNGAPTRSTPRMRVDNAAATNIATGMARPATGADARPPGIGSTNVPAVAGGGEVLGDDGAPLPLLGSGLPAEGTSDGVVMTATAGGVHIASRDLTAMHAVSGSRLSTAQATPGAQLSGRIEQAVANGQTTLTVRLDPEHLGRVEVKLEMQDGRVTAMIAAEKPATLDMLQRDARLIERALEQGGMQVQPDGLQFSLREGGSQWAEADQGRRGTQHYGQQVWADPVIDPLTPTISRSDSLVDIQI
jgi:flagellar hook-length control protein FliK